MSPVRDSIANLAGVPPHEYSYCRCQYAVWKWYDVSQGEANPSPFSSIISILEAAF